MSEKDNKSTPEVVYLNGKNDREILDFIYNVESFCIDFFYDNKDSVPLSPEEQEKLGRTVVTQKKQNIKDLEELCAKLKPVLLKLGIREQTKGFRLIQACVLEGKRLIENGEDIKMKSIYHPVCQSYGITFADCEKICRYACHQIVIPKDFAKVYPSLSYLTRRTYEKITVKELVSALTFYAANREAI